MDQVRRGKDTVVNMGQDGIPHLVETMDELIKTSRGGVRPNWRNLKSGDLTTREVLFSVRDTLRN
jgi:hypothetical protein